MPLIALRPFLDGKGRMIEVGDTLPTDYDKPTLDHYARLGMAGEGKANATRTTKLTASRETKPAAPTETQSDAAAAEAKATE